MRQITNAIRFLSARARERRYRLFKNTFLLDENTKILDLGSETGSNIQALLKGTPVRPENVYIADISLEPIQRGREMFGYVPVHLDGVGQLPFSDGYFDIVYCSSVIEHVTIPKERVWSLRSGRQFRSESIRHQEVFANEIRRLGRQFFVQTPHRYFPIESHTWLPFLGWLPRRLLIPILVITNRVWVKKTSPDWNLLTIKEMANLFDEAKIMQERFFGMTKSIMAVKTSF